MGLSLTQEIRMSKDRTQRLMINLSEYESRLLTYWARIHGRPRSTYAAQIIGARLEANVDLIKRQMADIAAYEGISVEELEKQWLGDGAGDDE